MSGRRMCQPQDWCHWLRDQKLCLDGGFTASEETHQNEAWNDGGRFTAAGGCGISESLPYLKSLGVFVRLHMLVHDVERSSQRCLEHCFALWALFNRSTARPHTLVCPMLRGLVSIPFYPTLTRLLGRPSAAKLQSEQEPHVRHLSKLGESLTQGTSAVCSLEIAEPPCTPSQKNMEPEALPLLPFSWTLLCSLQGIGAPASSVLLTRWFASQERGTWWGLWNIGANVGGFLTPLLVGTVASTLGWQWGMWVPGLIGLLFAVGCLTAVRDSPEEAGYTVLDSAEGGGGGGTTAQPKQQEDGGMSIRAALKEVRSRKARVWTPELSLFSTTPHAT
eukprot:364769-Chlamydomonas_euryale.AAC.3